MHGLEFGSAHEDARSLIQSARSCLKEHPQPDPAWDGQIRGCDAKLDGEGRLRVVLVGQFSAGKSSLLKALTGLDVEIDADVSTTTIREVAWRGVTLVDTPGVQAQQAGTEHDALSRQATIGADLVLFVMTNELFTDRLARYFHYLADESGLGLASKMAVVINKMDREINGPEIVTAEVVQVIEPHRDMLIFPCAVQKYLDAERAPEHLRQRFIDGSGVAALVNRLDAFIRERGAAGRIATPLQGLEEVLGEAMTSLGGEGTATRRELELLRRQRRLIENGCREIDGLIRVHASRARSAVSRLGEEAVKQIREGMSQEEIEQLMLTGMNRIEPQMDELFSAVTEKFDKVISDVEEELDKLGQSQLGAAVAADRAAAERTASLRDGIGDQSKVDHALRVARKPVTEMLKGAAKDTKLLKAIVLKVGKALGKKFRPWEAVKIARFLGKALPFVTAAIDLYMNYREEKAEDERRRQLALARIEVQRAFSEQGEQEAEALRKAIIELRDQSLGAALKQTEHDMQAISATESSHAALSNTLGSLLSKSRELRQSLST